MKFSNELYINRFKHFTKKKEESAFFLEEEMFLSTDGSQKVPEDYVLHDRFSGW